MMKYKIMLLLFLGIAAGLEAQEVIQFRNPSLEGTPRPSTLPKGWENCGFEEESPTDIQPSGDFGVYTEAKHGKTYVGMVVRDNDSWECIGQVLSRRLEKGTCYRLGFEAAQSSNFISQSRVTQTTASYTTPCIIRIWGGFKNDTGYQIMAASAAVATTDWAKYTLEFTPSDNFDYIYFESYYDSEIGGPYNGHVLIDHLSPIVPCSLIKGGQSLWDFEQ
jgi:hypothetical protein